MAQSDELTQRLFEAVDTIIGERISSLPYDQTIVCKIIDDQDKANGIYTVSHNFDTTFTAYADFTGFEVDDEVYVRIPEGDYTKQKVITGKYLEGILLAGETQNISIVGDTSYLLYDKNNQIHLYDWSKTEHEIQFSYFNTANEDQTWKDVLNTFSNFSMDYERANAIKLTIGNNDEVIVYLYKYKDSNKKDRFAAEQYGITPPTYIPDIEQHEYESQAFIAVTKETLFVSVTEQMTYNDKVRYYILDDNNNYIWVNNAASEMTGFTEGVNYYYIPSNIDFYQDARIDEGNITSPEDLTPINVNPLDANGHLIEIEDVFDFTQTIWYWVPGELELDVSNIPMLNTAKIYYTEEDTGANGKFHLVYTVAPVLDTTYATIPINIQYCPSGETTNIRANTTLTFGYITELNEEINIDLYLKRTIDGVTDIVPAVTVGDQTGQYTLEVLLTDKFGNTISNDIFSYRWTVNGLTINDTTGTRLISNVLEMPLQGQIITLCIGFINNNDFITYRTLYYPLAYRINSKYYIEGPAVITYNEAGVNPSYYDGIIQLKTYDDSDLDKDCVFTIPTNSLYTLIEDRVMSVYNIYRGVPNTSYFIVSVDGVPTWFQSLYFTKKERQEYIQVKNYQEQENPAHGYPGALAAQATGSSGLAINYTSSILSVEQYNNAVNTTAPIFYADSTGALKIGYDNFTMTGHISEGARYLESSLNNPIQQGSLLKPVYFTSAGVPEAIGTAILNTSAVVPDDDVDTYKIVPQLATSRIETVSNNKTINNADNGKFLVVPSTTTITLPRVTPGLEFELMWFGSTGSATFSASNTTLVTVDEGNGINTITVSEKGGVIAAKYLGEITSGNYYWIITGTID